MFLGPQFRLGKENQQTEINLEGFRSIILSIAIWLILKIRNKEAKRHRNKENGIKRIVTLNET